FLWVGTETGLNRYDGYKFKVYKYNAKDASSIIGNSITKIFEDPEGNIWVQTNYGLSIYDPVTDKFSSNTQPFFEKYNLPGNIVLDIYEDNDENFWFIIKGQGIAKYNLESKETTSLLHSFLDKSTISSNDVAAMAQNEEGDYWVIHQDGILEKIDKNTLKVVAREDRIADRYSRAISYGLMVDSENDVWVNFPFESEGLFLYQQENNEVIHFSKGSYEFPL